MFQPNGLLLADTARQGRLRIPVEVTRREDRSWVGHARDHLNNAMNKASSFLSADDLPIYIERRRQRANDFAEVLAALSGEPRRALRQDAGGELVLSVAVPIQDLRLVRGALLVSISKWPCLMIFGPVVVMTLSLARRNTARIRANNNRCENGLVI